MMKLCSYCAHPAEYSLVSVVSSIGISKRLQKCSPAVLFCAECLQKLLKGELRSTDKLLEAVNTAYTAVTRRLAERSTATDESN
jgi:hypothetical protein